MISGDDQTAYHSSQTPQITRNQQENWHPDSRISSRLQARLRNKLPTTKPRRPRRALPRCRRRSRHPSLPQSSSRSRHRTRRHNPHCSSNMHEPRQPRLQPPSPPGTRPPPRYRPHTPPRRRMRRWPVNHASSGSDGFGFHCSKKTCSSSCFCLRAVHTQCAE
jgi:hypothetical protein